jgi:flagellar biosynthetic protein FliR
VDELTGRIVASLLLSLRIAPMLAFAPPFTLVRVPAMVRLILSIALGGWLAASYPQAAGDRLAGSVNLPAIAFGELLLGITLALPLQLAFAALLTAGRAIDIQAGYGLAVLVDPATRTQMPLVGSLLAYAGAAIFFAIGGGNDLLAAWAASVERTPLGGAAPGQDPAVLIEFMGAALMLAMGVVGIVLIVLFLLDLAIAFMSRTLPQMNVLLLGFQVKALATLMLLPVAFALSGALFVRLLRAALETMVQLG